MRPDSVAPGQRALNQLDQRVVVPLRPRPAVFLTAPLGQRIDRSLECSPTLRVESAIDRVRPVWHQGDVQPAPRVISLRLFEEAVWVGSMLRRVAKLAQLEN